MRKYIRIEYAVRQRIVDSETKEYKGYTHNDIIYPARECTMDDFDAEVNINNRPDLYICPTYDLDDITIKYNRDAAFYEGVNAT